MFTNIVEYLKEQGCDFKVTEHEPAFTASRLLAVEHVPPRQVDKTVVVRAGYPAALEEIESLPLDPFLM